MDKKAKICATCKRNQIATWRKVIGLPLLIVAIIVMLGTIASLGGNTSTVSSSVSNKINLEKFNSIQTDMTYDEVIAIIGSEGALLSESELLDIKTQMYVFYGKDGISNANITFQNNKEVMKAQFGLK